MSSLEPQRPARTPTWTRVLYSGRTSVILTVALVPVLIGQILKLLDWVPDLVILVFIAALIVLLFGVLTHQELKFQRAALPPGPVTKIENPEWIDLLVCTANVKVPLDPDNPSTVETLLTHLPKVSAVRLIFSSTADNVEAQKQALVAWIEKYLGRKVTVDAVVARLDANQVLEGDIERLANELRTMDASRNVAIDITGGTGVMTITAYEAATRAGIPVTYIAQLPGRVYAGLSSLSDPNGVFERSPST